MRRIALLLMISLLLTACGKKGALIYPDMLVPASPGSFSAMQSGDHVKLSFALPNKDRAGRRVHDIAGAKIFRLESPSGQAPVCRNCTGYELFRTFYPEIPGDARQYGSLVVMLDGNVRQEREYTYKAVAFTRDGIDGEATAPLHVAMAPLPPPPSLRITPTITELRLEFKGGVPAGSTLVGYNLYRKQKGEPWPYLPLNAKPLAAAEFVDTGLDRRETYHYVARSVLRLPTNQTVESLPSNEVEGILKNDE